MSVFPNTRLKILVASGLWLILGAQLIALGCASAASMDNPPTGVVVEAIQKMNHRTGEYTYFLKIEYDVDAFHHNSTLVHVDLRDWMRFGRAGARICLYPSGNVWRIGACKA